MLRALEAALDEAEAADGVRVVLLCGEGKGFCAGGDVDAWVDNERRRFPGAVGALSATASSTGWRGCASRPSPCCPAMRWAAGWNWPSPAISALAESHVKLGFPETSHRRGAGLVGYAACGTALRCADGAAHGARRRDLSRRRGVGLGHRRPGRGNRPGRCRSQGMGRQDRRARSARHRSSPS